MFTRKRFIFLCVTAWLIMDIKVEAYLSDCRGGYCFVISDTSHANELLDQSNAQQRCLSNGTQLVEIRNDDIQNALVNFIKRAYSQGLNSWKVLTNGKRSSGSSWIRLSSNDIGGGLTVYDQTDQSYAYGYLKSTTYGLDLYASRPFNGMGFICSGLTDCSGGAEISGQCYKSFTETLSWYDARNRCLDVGGDLASFDHITTNAGFNSMNGSWIDKSKSYWIGVRREWWTWQNTKSDVKYSDWMSGHPLNEVSRADSDCLCLSTTYWNWIECGCNQLWPFVCISATPTPTTTQSTSSTSRSTTANSAIVSDKNGVSSPTNPTTGTLKSVGNGTGGMQQSTGGGALVGIGVGVGVGGALIVIALVAVVIILCRKRCPIRCPERKKIIAKPQPPDILMKDGTENPYAQVVPSSPDLNNTDPTIVYSNDTQTHTVYAPLGFHDGSVAIVAGKTQPAPVTNPPKNDAATNHFKVGGDLYAEVTKA